MGLSYVLGVAYQNGRVKLKTPLYFTIICLMVIGTVARPDPNQLGGQERTGLRYGQLQPENNGENSQYDTLKTVERMNYGVSFSPIDGVYTPTEATYNLMLVMDVPQFRPKGIPWWKCVKDANSTCLKMDMCLYLAPRVAPQNRSGQTNHTCTLLRGFVENVQRTRGGIAKGFLNRLRAYVELSAEYSGNETPVRKTRDTSHDSQHTGVVRNVNEGVDGSSTTENIPSLIPCNKINTTTEYLSCLAHSLQYKTMTKTDTETRHNRQKRDTKGSEEDTIPAEVLSEMNDLIEELELATFTAQAIDETVDQMRIPHLGQFHQGNRKARGLLNFGGKLLGSLFGLVTEEEAGDMQYAIEAISKNQYKLVERLTTFEKRVVAVANLTNHHLDRMTLMMKRIDRKFSNLFTEVHTGILASARFAALTSSMMLILMQDVERVNREMDQFLVGLRSLQRQELSVDLIPEEVLRQSLSDLERHITRKYDTFSVAELNPAYYYKYAKPAYSWDNGTLIIYLTVPLKSSNTAFELYHVKGYSIPAVQNESLYTRPILENDIFGISHDKVNFLEMKQEDLESCTIAKTIRCELSTVVRDVFHRSCLLALFENDKDAIHELCKYRLEAMQPELSLQPISPGRVLVSNAATVSTQCPGRPATVRPGCKSCVWNQPCSCSLGATDTTSKSVFISPTLTGCSHHRWEQKVEYPINIPALSRLASQDQLANISHDAYVDSLSKIPAVSIDVHPAAEELNIHEKYAYGMDIDTAVQQLKEHTFLTPFNLHKISREKDNGWVTFLPISLGVSLGLTAILGIAYLLRKKGCLMVKLQKPSQDPEKGNSDENDQEIPDELEMQENVPNRAPDAGRTPVAGGNPEPRDFKGMVAEVLRDLAGQARQSGILPPTLQVPHIEVNRMSGQIYPSLDEVQIHASTHETRM